MIYLTLPFFLSGVKFEYWIDKLNILQLNLKPDLLVTRANFTRISLMVMNQKLAGSMMLSGLLVKLLALFDLLFLKNT